MARILGIGTLAALTLILGGCGGGASSTSTGAVRAQNVSTPGGLAQDRFASTPAQAIRAYDQALNKHEYRQAYTYLASTGRPPYSIYVRQMKRWAHRTIKLLTVAGYRVKRAGFTYTCAGIQGLRQEPSGITIRYGEWYMTRKARGEGWQIVLPGSHIVDKAVFGLPTRAGCGAHIP